MTFLQGDENKSNYSAITKELVEKLEEIVVDPELIEGILIRVDNKEERQLLLDFVNAARM